MMRRLLCAVLGGHEWGSPQIVDGRLRLACLLGCGAMTAGITTRGMDRVVAQRVPLNLRSWRRRRVA
mgnify:CR=1 FL=1